MNRLILLGNGFDLAHKLKTSYNDFIVWYLVNALGNAKENRKYDDEVISVTKTRGEFIQHYCKDVTSYVRYFYEKGNLNPLLGRETITYDGKTHYAIPFKIVVHSNFMEKLLTMCNFNNWVDVENEYYISLKELLEQKTNKERDKLLKNLNASLFVLISSLEQYLKTQKAVDVNSSYSKILEQEILQDEFVHWGKVEKKKLEKTLILNFNYTSTVEMYIDPKEELDIEVNHIHGRLGQKLNPIIFGFGDELDEDYRKLELDKTRGFLKYIKSFWYFKTRNYHDLLRYIESSQYQVFILGHSCGLSDRTMLNLIFEHSNCMSIKIFFHEHSENETNYSELTEEISRHFTSKAEMREKIVPFPFCKKMPQLCY